MANRNDAYRKSLDYLYGLQRFGIKLGLENITTLLERSGRPDRDLRIIHVAGTNGKGSVCATLASILTRAGFRVGQYTSPHLHSFTERIQVDGRPIAEADVVRLTEELRSCAEGVPITFFEFTTAMALACFRRRKVDIALLEVGMGGRLDATNAVLPEVCVITPICRDHSEHLGADLAAIAGEKAGIIKPQVPVVIARQPQQVRRVLEEKARQVGASVFRCGRDFSLSPAGARFGFSGPGLELHGLETGLQGAHQRGNAALALAVIALLRRKGMTIGEEAIVAGLAQARWPGRLEWWRNRRAVLLDGAHNAGGAAALASYLETVPSSGVRWVVGMKRDKAAAEILAPLLPKVSAVYCTAAPIEEAMAPAALARSVRGLGREAAVFDRFEDALGRALGDRSGDEIVLVAGSLFLVAAAREFLLLQEKKSS